MKKIFNRIICSIVAVICVILMTSCSSNDNFNIDSSSIKNSIIKQETDVEIEKIQIVTTIYPIYDWVSQITKGMENIEITLLADSGVDLHNFQPTVDDIISISDSDMFIYVGGESDEWVEEVLQSDIVADTQNDGRIILSLVDILGTNVKAEEFVQGMEHLHEENSEELDEHVWLSLKNAEIFCDEILNALATLDNTNYEIYSINNENYKNQIKQLDELYEKVTEESEYNTVVVCDRFPFRYLVDDYGLDYYAMFSGCSTETDASFETIVFLANKIDELGLDTVITTETPIPKMAETVIENTENSNKMGVARLNSMQSITSTDLNENLSYLGIMEQNLEALKNALHYNK